MHVRRSFSVAVFPRIQRLREAAAARSHLKTPALRDLGYQPYTFVAKPSTVLETMNVGDGGAGRQMEDDSGWDDWGDDEVMKQRLKGRGGE